MAPLNAVLKSHPPNRSRDDLDVNRAKNIVVRVTEEERKAWQAAADADQRKLSDWIRVVINAQLDGDKPRGKKGGK